MYPALITIIRYNVGYIDTMFVIYFHKSLPDKCQKINITCFHETFNVYLSGRTDKTAGNCITHSQTIYE